MLRRRFLSLLATCLRTGKYGPDDDPQDEQDDPGASHNVMAARVLAEHIEIGVKRQHGVFPSQTYMPLLL